MATLQRRIEALEATTPTGGIELIVIRKVISADFPNAEMQVARIGDARYAREPGESEDDFRARLTSIAERLHATGAGPMRLIMSPFEEDL